MSFVQGSMSTAEREARAALAQKRVFDVEIVRGLLDDIDMWREIATNDLSKWSFDALLAMAKRMLDEVYPATIFTGESGDSGPQFVVALREAIERIDRIDRGQGS